MKTTWTVSLASWCVATLALSLAQDDAPSALSMKTGPVNTGSAATGDGATATAIEERAMASMRSLELAATLERERKTWSLREAELLQRIDELNTEILEERKRRTARETEWLEFTRALAALELPAEPAAPDFITAALASASQPDLEAEREEEAKRQRSVEILRELRTLLATEQVYGIDVLEVGRLGDGWTGPFVARLVDDYGRPVGNLAAERLRLEMSFSGHTVTLVLEQGYEHRAGVRVPFGSDGGQVAAGPTPDRQGIRRIHLPKVNPQHWIEALPELFGNLSGQLPIDDGNWDRAALRLRLNDLLTRRSGLNAWRIQGFGGVWRGDLRDVHWVEMDGRGRVKRRLFADRCSIRENGGGVRIDLYGGVQVRGDQRVPFLDGRFRIMLPQAQASDWVEAGLPGLGPTTVELQEDDGAETEAPSGG